jgi:hypothetical protein
MKGRDVPDHVVDDRAIARLLWQAVAGLNRQIGGHFTAGARGRHECRDGRQDDGSTAFG